MNLDGSVNVTELPNGLMVLTDRMEGVASATLGVWIGAGARHETAEENGVAHFLEHMAFKGTDKRTARAIAEEIEEVGGYLNAYTSRETTAYYARVLADDAPRALDILADILRNPTLSEEDIEVERGVILQEIGQSLDTPDDIVFDWAQEQAFPNQPIGRPILGPAGNVQRFGRHDLGGFMAARYSADRMIVAAAGAVEHDRIVALAEQKFGDVPPRSAAAPAPAAYAGGERRIEKALEQAHVVLGFRTIGYRSPDYYASQVYSTLLGGGMSSRLFQEARERRGLCYTIFSQPSHYAETGLLTIYAGTGGDQLKELIEVVADQMAAAASEAAADEVERARAQIRAGVLMGLESSSARCERLARAWLAHGRVPSIAEMTKKIDAVDVEAVRRFAGKVVSDASPTMTLYGPVAAAPALDRLQARLAA